MVHQLSSPIFPCLLPLTLAHSGALWLTLTHSGSLQLTLALSGTDFLTRPLLGLLHRSCIAPVYPPLLLVYAIGQFLPVWALLTLKIIKTSWPPDVVNICCGPPWQRSNGEVMAVFRWPPLLPFMAITSRRWGILGMRAWSEIFLFGRCDEFVLNTTLLDPSPFIGLPSQELTHSLTHWCCWNFNDVTLGDDSSVMKIPSQYLLIILRGRPYIT